MDVGMMGCELLGTGFRGLSDLLDWVLGSVREYEGSGWSIMGYGNAYQMR